MDLPPGVLTPQSNSTDDVLAASAKYFPAGWSGHVLRKKYTDPRKLKAALDEIYGLDQYKVVEKGGRWILGTPNPITGDESGELEKRVYNHY